MAVQSRRFIVNDFVLENGVETSDHLRRLGPGDVDYISYFCYNNTTLYLETYTKKRLNAVRNWLNMFNDVQSVERNPIEEGQILFCFGVPMGLKKLSELEKDLNTHYLEMKETKQLPRTEGNARFMVQEAAFNKVASIAHRENLKANYNIVLRPFQEICVDLALKQLDRKLLWVMDFTGNSGKTEIGKYLEAKENWQFILDCAPNDAANMLHQFKNGTCIDKLRSDVQDKLEYGLLEQLKNGLIQSGKYRGTSKQMLSNKVVVIANFFPNLIGLSIDRWSFFHTRLGEVKICCKD